jgi:hypothetical protein
MTVLDATAVDWTGEGPADHGLSGAGRDFVALGDRYILGFSGTGIEIEAKRLRRATWGATSADVMVRCPLPGARRLDGKDTIYRGLLSLSETRALQGCSKLLAERSQAEGIDWFGLLGEFAIRVLNAEEAGQPAVLLRDVPRPGPDRLLDVLGLKLPREYGAILFGDGGTLKSYLAEYIGGTLALRGIPTLYADWEFSADEHRLRLERLFGADMPGLWYIRCGHPLVDETDRIRTFIQDHAIQYVVVDSAGVATDGPPEAAEAANGYNRALRSWEIGSLSIAHITKSEQGDQKPFGSVFFHNNARMTWFVKRSAPAGDDSTVTVGLFNRKNNVGPLYSPLGLQFTFDGARTLIQTADLTDVDDLAADVPLWQRMRQALRHGPQTVAALAGELDSKVETIERVARGKGKSRSLFTRIPGSDGVTRLALVERRNT